MPHFLRKYKKNRYLVVDIGSGDGWLSAKLSKYFKRIIAIETSEEAVKLAKKRYKKYSNINWINGFVEDCISKIVFNKPVLFTSCHVLSHFTDNQVLKVCKIINSKKIPKNSILNFAELYTKGYSIRKYMDTSRSIKWWNINLSNWQLDFHGPKVSKNKNEKRFKGFWGHKII
jgi:2-polyprenyl-3-methyl-5-hydroxy-6-metoxy-1,4-benzoquinol methylase